MQVFKTDKKDLWKNELKSWLLVFPFAILLYFGFSFFTSLKNDSIIIGLIIMLLLKLGDTLTQFHVEEIQIDNPKKQLTFILNSIMSGEKIKRYQLDQASSKLIVNTGFKKYLLSPFTLKIFLKPKDIFRISNRYGFSLEILTLVDKAIKSTNEEIVP